MSTTDSTTDVRELERLCAGTRKDGLPCNSYAWLNNGYCRAHQGQAPADGDAVADGDPADASPPAADIERRSVLPGRFREELAEDLAADYTSVHEVLRSAMSAEVDQWIQCTHCQRRTPVKLADTRARLDAIKLWSELGYGRAAAAPGGAQPAKLADLDRGKNIEQMTDAELEALLLSSYLANPEKVEEERNRRETIVSALERGETVEQAAIRAVEQIGVSHARLAEALGLTEAPVAA